ncbi:MAG: endolytic transglycosylase MltG, partial [Rickettsiales bacterium]|nr:endolytic transglycosylase MltG [Rickettsiales bacterium]
MKFFLRICLFLIVLALITAGGAYFYVTSWFSAAGPLKEDVVIYIEPGTGFRKITTILKENNILDQDMLFQAMAYKRNEVSKVKAGEYQFKAQVSPKDVLETLVKGESVTYAVTVPEGLNVKEIQLLLMSDNRLTGP